MITKEQKKIAELVTSIRKERGMTQTDLARLLKTSQSAVTRMEHGDQNFSAAMLAKVSKALGRDIIQPSKKTINFTIEGGKALSGTVIINTAKNSAVALLAASLINEEKTTFVGMPRVDDVFSIIRVMESIGVSVEWIGQNQLTVLPPKTFDFSHIDIEAAANSRSVLLFIGALIHHVNNFSIPHSGGCKLGTRTVRPHVFALERLGLKIKTTENSYEVRGKLHATDEVILYESGDTVTENLIMAASALEAKTIIKYASANYMVQELCTFLSLLGVSFEGIGTTTLSVKGKAYSQQITYYIGEDPTEAMLFLALAAVTKSSLRLQRIPIEFLELELLKLEKMGFRYKILKRYKSQNRITHLVDIQTYASHLRALEEKIYARPYPGLNIDNLPFFVPIAAVARGTTLIHDWVYENRALYYLELAKLAVTMRLADPHRVYIDGPANFTSAEIICPPALRPAAVILIAMLAAKGTSILRNVYSINRGYEDLYTRLKHLGANIALLSEW